MRLLRAIKVQRYPAGPDRETLPRFSPLGLWVNLSFINKAVELWLSQSVSEHVYGANRGDSYLEKKVVANSSIALEDARTWDGLSPHWVPLPGSWMKASGSPLLASSCHLSTSLPQSQRSLFFLTYCWIIRQMSALGLILNRSKLETNVLDGMNECVRVSCSSMSD